MGNTPEDITKEAVSKIRNDGYGLRQASKVYGIPVTTLQRYLLKFKQTANIEEELKEYLILSSKIHHGLTKKKCKLLAYELAEKNKLKVPNSWKVNKIEGKDWFKRFRKRRPQISIRKPEATSLARELREQTPQPSTSKESFGSNEADPPLDNFKELTDWEIRERTPESSTNKENCHSPKRNIDPGDFTVENEDFPTEHVSEVEQFVLVCEGERRNKMKMYSVGEITEISDDDIA
ncbi:hypothetical protein ILUMI_04641, partial [Ignelater luminosus]